VTRIERMRRKLQTKVGAAMYAARKGIVEPVGRSSRYVAFASFSYAS